jgi:nitrite reductase/ring-hydroxylating ferredoxin subunit
VREALLFVRSNFRFPAFEKRCTRVGGPEKLIYERELTCPFFRPTYSVQAGNHGARVAPKVDNVRIKRFLYGRNEQMSSDTLYDHTFSAGIFQAV